ncbi:MAG TPA: EAL domain-containing protein [Burkholderiaceae bacterium]
MSASLNSMLGVALLLLWRQDRQHLHVRAWGWSWILLGLGLIIGPALQDFTPPGPLHDLQALLASTGFVASLFLLVGGALIYRGRRPSMRASLPGFFMIMLILAAVGSRDYRAGLVLGSIIMSTGSLVAAALMWRGGNRTEQFVSIGFVAATLVHASSPLLEEHGRSPITHVLGLYVQAVLSLGLILLSVARAHSEARRQAERFARLAEHSLQGLAVIRDHRMLYANPAALALFNYEGVTGTVDLLDLTPNAAERAVAQRRHSTVLSDSAARIEWESERLTKDGRVVHLRGLSSHLEWDGSPAELLVMVDDTQRHAAVEALRRQALHDDLTDLPNRNFVVERLQTLCQPGSPAFALLSADLDRFQLVNESLGHEAGDALLHAIARRLDSHLPGEVVLARLGEDQFVLIAPDLATPERAMALAERMLALLAEPFAIQGSELFVHMSVGIALYPRDADSATALLRAADAAMHRAKATPGASTLFFDLAMKHSSQHKLELEQALGRAIAAGEFLLEYQPKFRAGTRALSGFEALLRWQRSGGQRVSPAEFIPIAERTGQIKALGDRVLTLACAQVRAWRQRFGHCPAVAINVSALQFEDPLFVDRFLARLLENQLPRGSIDIEITETTAIGHLDKVLPQLVRLREAGVACALDDFGTGQSSLTMLRQLPIATLKLDRSMIDPLPRADASAIVQASCVLGRSLGMEIVAEGVETEEQAAAAEALGCTQLQGYLLGRPLSAEAAGGLLSAPLMV